MVFKLQPKSAQKLEDSMRKSCAAIDTNKCENLVKCMPSRMKAIIKA